MVIFSKQKTDFIVLASFSKKETLARTVSHSHHRYYAYWEWTGTSYL